MSRLSSATEGASTSLPWRRSRRPCCASTGARAPTRVYTTAWWGQAADRVAAGVADALRMRWRSARDEDGLPPPRYHVKRHLATPPTGCVPVQRAMSRTPTGGILQYDVRLPAVYKKSGGRAVGTSTGSDLNLERAHERAE